MKNKKKRKNNNTTDQSGMHNYSKCQVDEQFRVLFKKY